MTKKYINPDFEKLPLKRLFVISVIISGILIIVGLVCQIFLPPQIPLFYGLPQTDSQLAPSILIILPPIIASLVTLINVGIAIKVNDNFLKKTLAFSSLSICILVTITTLKIIFLISSF
jgi:O-antigen/teichoic acid export membrane protein